jgi:hypothetical protein
VERETSSFQGAADHGQGRDSRRSETESGTATAPAMANAGSWRMPMLSFACQSVLFRINQQRGRRVHFAEERILEGQLFDKVAS